MKKEEEKNGRQQDKEWEEEKLGGKSWSQSRNISGIGCGNLLLSLLAGIRTPGSGFTVEHAYSKCMHRPVK